MSVLIAELSLKLLILRSTVGSSQSPKTPRHTAPHCVLCPTFSTISDRSSCLTFCQDPDRFGMTICFLVFLFVEISNAMTYCHKGSVVHCCGKPILAREMLEWVMRFLICCFHWCCGSMVLSMYKIADRAT